MKLATEQVLLSSPDYDWERVDFWVNEGPAAGHMAALEGKVMRDWRKLLVMPGFNVR